MRLLVPAKINLHLRVGPVRADGYHPLLTWMCTVGLFDTLDIRRAGGDGTTLTIEPTDGRTGDRDAAPASSGGVANGLPDLRSGGAGKGIAVPADGTNLVARAASLWVTAVAGAGAGPRGATAPPRRGISIVLGKGIPVGAGLGGGSADAARTLIALNRLDAAGLSPGRLAGLGASLGSDVPFFCHGPSSLCTGRGETVTPLPIPRPKWAALFLPERFVSTADVYRRFDALNLGRPADVDPLALGSPDFAAWAALPATALLPLLANDLERPAFDLHPDLGTLRAAIEDAIGRVVRMSGSGSSLFTLFDDRAEAETAARRVDGHGVRVEVVEMCPKVD